MSGIFPEFLKDDGVLIASGIIGERTQEVAARWKHKGSKLPIPPSKTTGRCSFAEEKRVSCLPRFFTEQITKDTALITGEDAAHIGRVLRMQRATRSSCATPRHRLSCAHHPNSSARGAAGSAFLPAKHRGPTVRVRLFQAMPKGDKLDLIVQKAVELGACEVIPVLSKRCVSRPDRQTMGEKERAVSAHYVGSRQAVRQGNPPAFSPLLTFEQALEEMKRDERAIMFYENATAPLKKLLEQPFTTLSILIAAKRVRTGGSGRGPCAGASLWRRWAAGFCGAKPRASRR